MCILCFVFLLLNPKKVLKAIWLKFWFRYSYETHTFSRIKITFDKINLCLASLVILKPHFINKPCSQPDNNFRKGDVISGKSNSYLHFQVIKFKYDNLFDTVWNAFENQDKVFMYQYLYSDKSHQQTYVSLIG